MADYVDGWATDKGQEPRHYYGRIMIINTSIISFHYIAITHRRDISYPC